MRQWDGEHAVVRHDAESGTWIFVCIHSTKLGPAMGGTRLKPYNRPAQALEDGLRRTYESSTLSVPYRSRTGFGSQPG